MKAWLIAAALVALVPAAGRAEIVKTAVIDDQCHGICANWWPKLDVPDGWVFDEAFSRRNNVNFIYPKDDPDNVGIYAGAVQVDNQADTVQGFMDDDRATFLKNNPGMTITAGADLKTADGQVLHSLVFHPGNGQNYDITAYGEETDADGNQYYLTFSLSAPSKEQYDRYMAVFQQVISAYRK